MPATKTPDSAEASLLPNNAFALAIGGGIGIAVSEHFGIRLVDADYELTRFENSSTGGNNSQSNFRFQTGVQFRF